MAKQYRIKANGMDMGTYDATSEAEALNAYARDAGYADYADLCATVGSSHGEATAEEQEA